MSRYSKLHFTRIAGYPVLRAGLEETAELLCLEAESRRRRGGRPAFHTAINGQVVWLSGSDADLARCLSQADVISCDSQPIVFYSRSLRKDMWLPERVATTDLIHSVARRSEREQISFFLLGATEAVNQAAFITLSTMYPNLKIVGRHHGYFSRAEEATLCETISQARPDILWVGLGVPLEQAFFERNADRLEGVGVVKTCGGCFRILAGEIARPSKFMQKIGLEWLGRLFIEPQHVFKRYLIGNTAAVWLTLTRRYR